MCLQDALGTKDDEIPKQGLPQLPARPQNPHPKQLQALMNLISPKKKPSTPVRSFHTQWMTTDIKEDEEINQNESTSVANKASEPSPEADTPKEELVEDIDETISHPLEKDSVTSETAVIREKNGNHEKTKSSKYTTFLEFVWCILEQFQ